MGKYRQPDHPQHIKTAHARQLTEKLAGKARSALGSALGRITLVSVLPGCTSAAWEPGLPTEGRSADARSCGFEADRCSVLDSIESCLLRRQVLEKEKRRFETSKDPVHRARLEEKIKT